MDQPIPCQRQAGEGSQSQKGAIADPERHHLPNRKQASLLTKTSWDCGQSASTRRVAARNQLPRRDTQHTWESAPVVHPENRAAGRGEAISHSLHLEATALTKHLVTWAAWSWKEHKIQAQPSLHLCGVPENLNLSGLDLGSAYNSGPASDSSRQSNLEPKQCSLGKHKHHKRGQTQCGRDTVSTHQWYSFAVFLPPHSTSEQVSLKKWPLPPCVRAEIRHWRDQQTEEAKTNRGNCSGSDRCNRLKPYS